MMRDAPQSDAGFTLVETLVALLILSIMAVAGASLLLRSTETGKQVREKEIEIRALDIAQSFIRDDLESVTTRAAETVEGRGGARILIGGDTSRTDALLGFTRNGWINPDEAPRSGLQSVSYRLTDDGDLIRQASLRPDPVESTPVVEQVLFRKVAGVDFSFWRDGEISTYWEAVPVPPDDLLPERIEMTIRFDDERTLTVASMIGGASS